MANLNILVELSIKVTGGFKGTKKLKMGMEKQLFLQSESRLQRAMRETGLMTRWKALEFTDMLTDRHMRVSGGKVNNTVRAFYTLQMEQNTKENGKNT